MYLMLRLYAFLAAANEHYGGLQVQTQCARIRNLHVTLYRPLAGDRFNAAVGPMQNTVMYGMACSETFLERSGAAACPYNL